MQNINRWGGSLRVVDESVLQQDFQCVYLTFYFVPNYVIDKH